MMVATKLVYVGLILISLLLCFVKCQEYQSECHFARITGGGTDNSHTCGFDVPAQANLMPSWFTTGGEAGADSETYNGFPFLASPMDIPPLGNGTGAACGECFEITGLTGVPQHVMISDVCDKTCCSDCQGSLGGAQGGSDIQEFGIKNAFCGANTFYSSITGLTNSGQGIISYRKIACPLEGKTIGFYIMYSGGVIRFFNYRVGIDSVYLSQNGSEFTKLTRDWTNKFLWNGGGLNYPLVWKVVSIYNESIETQSISQAQANATNTLYDSAAQFTVIANPTQFEDIFTSTCPWLGPPQVIYANGSLYGEKNVAWGLGYGGPADVVTNYVNSGVGCDIGCVHVPASSISGNYWSVTIYGQNQNLSDPKYGGIQFDIRSAAGNVSNLQIGWQKWNCGTTPCFDSCPSFVVPTFDTTWNTISIPINNFTWTGSCADYLVGFFGIRNAPGEFYLNNLQFYGTDLRNVAIPNTVCANEFNNLGNVNLPCVTGNPNGTTTGTVSTTTGTFSTTGSVSSSSESSSLNNLTDSAEGNGGSASSIHSWMHPNM